MIGLRRCGIFTQWNITQPWKNEILPFAATLMDLKVIILSEVSQKEKDKYFCGIQQVIQMNLYIKQKQTHTHRKQTHGYQRGEEQKGKGNLKRGGVITKGVWD